LSFIITQTFGGQSAAADSQRNCRSG